MVSFPENQEFIITKCIVMIQLVILYQVLFLFFSYKTSISSGYPTTPSAPVIHTVDDVVQCHSMPKSHEGHVDHIGNHRRRRQSLLKDFLTHESHYNTRENKVT